MFEPEEKTGKKDISGVEKFSMAGRYFLESD
jgi:hypothetical protein